MAKKTKRRLGKGIPALVRLYSDETAKLQKHIARVTDKSIPLFERKLLFKHLIPKDCSFNEVWYKKREGGGYHLYMINHEPTYTNTSIFVKKTVHSGLTFTQEKGLVFWRGTRLYTALHLLKKCWHFLGMEFILEDKGYLSCFLLERTLKKMFEGKVTNANHVLKMYLANKKLTKVPLAHFKKMVKRIQGIGEKVPEELRALTFERFYRASSNVERDSAFLCSATYKQLSELITSELFDTIQMANMVGKKVNLTWSARRWKQEHDRLSDFILKTKIKLGLFGDEAEIMQWAEELQAIQEELPEGYTVLKSNLDYLKEAEAMKHCIHTYVERAIKGDYIAISVTTGENIRYTCGLEKFKTKAQWKIDQIRGFRNKPPQQEEYKAILTTMLKLKSISVFDKLLTD